MTPVQRFVLALILLLWLLAMLYRYHRRQYHGPRCVRCDRPVPSNRDRIVLCADCYTALRSY